ncbi:MAG: class II aldolase/adducin family protein [Burkholderiaceae bacterium]
MCQQSPGEPIPDSGIPSPAAPASLIDELVVANQILFRHGVVDAFGHISVRHPDNPERFLLARNMAPALVTADDIVEFNLDGQPVNAGGRPVYLERFIHGEILRQRPDVIAVVHSHAPAVVPFGVVRGASLQPIWHMSYFLSEQTPVFEIRDTAGDGSDMLIRSQQLGAALANSLADGQVVLMRGHGVTVTGGSIRQAVYNAVYTQMNAELQLKASVLGPAQYLSPAEVAAARVSVGSQVNRAWDLWVREATG